MSWLEEALGCIKLIDSLCDSEAKSAFRTRARQIPSEIYYIGTTYAFAVLAARSSEKTIYAPGNLASKIGAICKENLSKEEKGYAIYGACLLEALKKLGIPAGNLVDTLKALDEKGAVVDMEIAEFVGWLKKLAEAKFEPEK